MKIKQRELIADPRIFSEHGEFGSRILASRTTDSRPVNSMASMLPPQQLKGLTAAADIVFSAIQSKQRIVIVGDYDADGATGTAIGLHGLSLFGAKVGFIVPNRFTDGYGLSPGVVERAMEMKPNLFLTVDNGISAFLGIEAAGKMGIPVVVTDHHLPGDGLPDAAAIVNPNQPGCEFESKNIAGCGVMFYLMIAIRSKFRAISDPRGNVDLRVLLDLLAIGTVADVVKLDHNNRIFVNAGLQMIRQGLARPGIKNIFEVSKRNARTASSEDLGFYIGPRINAAGRMEDASVGIACLSTFDQEDAHRLALSLHATNQERRAVQQSIENEAVLDLPVSIDESMASICLFNENWHEGVIGVVAGKLKERFYRPTIVFTRVDEDSAKGSGRSIPGLHLRDCLDLVNKRHPGLIKKFGGHAMAAGLTIDLRRMGEFQKAFANAVTQLLDPADLRQTIEHDGHLSGKDLAIHNPEWIASQVWGQGFPSPSFLIESPKILSQRILKEAHLKLDFEIGGQRVSGIWFGQAQEMPPGTSFVGKMSINEYNGNRSTQIMIETDV